MSAMDTSQTPPHRHAYRAADAVLRSHTPTSQFGKSALVRQCLDGTAFAPPTKQRERKADAASALRCCAACLRPGATRRCGRCGKASYCSKDCQRTDWARHKKTCLGRDDALNAPIQSLTSELSNVFRLGEDALKRAGLPNPSVSWSKEVLEALCDCCLLPGLQLVPSDDRPHEGLGLGLRTIALLFLRHGATPTPKLYKWSSRTNPWRAGLAWRIRRLISWRAHGAGDVSFRSSLALALRRRVDSARAVAAARVFCPIATGAFIGTGVRRG
ncbi:unnamed protein product [Pelagomonas calceolata]|uniref:MYND-type domain-containing protein n=1 Tax=Pelagomonas calceolata TaxID=35677 RepID=A0A8J2WD20_9STRA|nr:unnamed protein product [Pelagomonas calceolata]